MKVLTETIQIRISKSLRDQLSWVSGIHDAKMSKVIRAILWISVKNRPSTLQDALQHLDELDTRG